MVGGERVLWWTVQEIYIFILRFPNPNAFELAECRDLTELVFPSTPSPDPRWKICFTVTLLLVIVPFQVSDQWTPGPEKIVQISQWSKKFDSTLTPEHRSEDKQWDGHIAPSPLPYRWMQKPSHAALQKVSKRGWRLVKVGSREWKTFLRVRESERDKVVRTVANKVRFGRCGLPQIWEVGRRETTTEAASAATHSTVSTNVKRFGHCLRVSRLAVVHPSDRLDWPAPVLCVSIRPVIIQLHWVQDCFVSTQKGSLVAFRFVLASIGWVAWRARLHETHCRKKLLHRKRQVRLCGSGAVEHAAAAKWLGRFVLGACVVIGVIHTHGLNEVVTI